ncbi:MAG: hypothetical protein Kilf2KO_21620 [Rhodospirillales bacterium]
MSCEQLQADYTAQRDIIAQLHQQDIQRQRNNAALAALTLIGGIGVLAAMDSGEANDTETEALLKRNLRLSAVAREKGCDELTPSMDDVVASLEAEKAAKEAARLAQEEARKQAEEQR